MASTLQLQLDDDGVVSRAAHSSRTSGATVGTPHPASHSIAAGCRADTSIPSKGSSSAVTLSRCTARSHACGSRSRRWSNRTAASYGTATIADMGTITLTWQY